MYLTLLAKLLALLEKKELSNALKVVAMVWAICLHMEHIQLHQIDELLNTDEIVLKVTTTVRKNA